MSDDPAGVDRCVICNAVIENGEPRTWTAHWGGPGNVVIVAWTCSPEHTETYLASKREGI